MNTTLAPIPNLPAVSDKEPFHPHDDVPSLLRSAPLAVTQLRVIRSEWIKLRSVSSTKLSLVVAVVIPIVLGGIFASTGDGGPVQGTDSLSLSLAGFRMAQLLIGVIGVILVANEYASGQIRSTLQAVRSRTSIVTAKSITYASCVSAMSVVSVFGAYFVGKASYGGTLPAISLSDSGAIRVIGGTVLFSVSIGLLGVALGFLLRSTAAAIGILFGSLFIVPALIGLLPWSAATSFAKFLPSNAGDAVTALHRSTDLLSPTSGALTLVAWVAGLLVVSAMMLRRRDA
jgi:ABC-2 type transport system permease protein